MILLISSSHFETESESTETYFFILIVVFGVCKLATGRNLISFVATLQISESTK